VRSYASIYLPIASKYGLKTIIHSHATTSGSGFLSIVKTILQYPLRYQADYFIGCSQLAGEWLFGERVVRSDRYFMLNNGVDLKDFEFDLKKRQAVRSEFGIGEEIVFGHVGRFHEAKNHKFLLELFGGINEQMQNTKLIIAGDGDLRSSIERKIQTLGLSDSVILAGNRSDVPELMMAFDCFLFPSLWEGLPVAVVEAQASGLPCFVSDTITKEVSISELVRYLPIDKGIDVWHDALCNHTFKRKDVSVSIKKAGFDVSTTANWLMCFYLKL